MTKEIQEKIFSSTGNLGVSRRQDQRLYVNGTHAARDYGEVAGNFNRLVGITERKDRLSRAVYRGIVSNEVLESILLGPLRETVEVALPLDEFDHSDSWLVYMAKNKPERNALVPLIQMIDQTKNPLQNNSVEEQVAKVFRRGMHVIHEFSDEHIAQLHELWGGTFGWSVTEIQALQRRIEKGQIENSEGRSIWFSGILYQDQLVSAAMAERLELPGLLGPVTIVESTEWRTRDEYAGQGLMAATIAMLNTQILADLEYSGTQPLIIAECNFLSRSDRAGIKSGFRIPERDIKGMTVSQILEQNVLVSDGHVLPKGKLRDFTFMYVPNTVIEAHYSPDIQLSLLSCLKSVYV
ncbi:hypothetical protein BH11PAT1_BH11PAT1_0260 [soil metagenome]